MAKEDEFFKQTFEVLEQEEKPTEQQKAIMLHRILLDYKAENVSDGGRLKRLFVLNPWKFAFTLSVVQAVVFTLIFGTQYTNLFLNFFGG